MTRHATIACMATLMTACGCQPTPAPIAPPAASEQPPVGAAADASTLAPPPGLAASPASATHLVDAPWWGAPYPKPFDAKKLPNRLEFIGVKGNHFVDESGKVRVFQGVSIADPDILTREGQWSRALFEAVKSWGANVVRIPVHPAAWRGRGRDSYLALLDQALIWSNELSLYVIIDWHSIGNLRTELFQHAMYETTLRETLEFWRTMAFRYQGISTSAFYELFNEPTTYNGTLGVMSWDEWKSINEEIISVIYAHDQRVIPLVAGFNWAYELGPVASAPIQRDGIAYVAHPYPMKTGAPYAQHWDAAFGFVAQRYPLFATEIGYMRADQPGAHDPVIDDGSYGPRMTGYLEQRGASWVAWCFHPDWSPQLIQDWAFTPTESGAHFRQVMQARLAGERPSSAP